MAQASADFETGTNTNTIATSDTGSATAFDVVTIGASATAIYDNTHAKGNLAGKFVVPVSSTTCFVQWSSGTLGTLSDTYGRIYVYRITNPATASAGRWVDFLSSGTLRGGIRVNTSGKVELWNSSAAQFTSTNSIALNAWNRIEFHVVFSATVGHFEAKLYKTDADSTGSPDETIGDQTTNLNMGGSSVNTAAFGFPANAASSTVWLDNIIMGATSYPGPGGGSTTNSTLSASVTSVISGSSKTPGKVLVP